MQEKDRRAAMMVDSTDSLSRTEQGTEGTHHIGHAMKSQAQAVLWGGPDMSARACSVGAVNHFSGVPHFPVSADTGQENSLSGYSQTYQFTLTFFPRFRKAKYAHEELEGKL